MTFLLMGMAGAAYSQQIEAASNTTIPVACTINGKPAGDISVTLSPNGKLLSVDASALAALLKRMGTETLLTELSRLTAKSKMVSTENLRATGLSITFDSQKLQLQITVPRKLQRVTAIRITENKPPSNAIRVDPATFSAQLSASGQLDLLDDFVSATPSAPSTNSIDVPFSLSLNPAVNYRTWVLESDMSMNTSAEPFFSLGDLRLVKDFPGPDLRLMAGTLSYATTGFSSGIPILGVGIGSKFDLSPTKLFRPLGHLGFYLEQPSLVTVLVNGQPVRYLNLQAGPYDLSDLPFTPGTNNVVLEIRDSQGHVERVAKSFAFAQDLLLPGQSSFSANIGLPGRQLAPPVFSGYERIGIRNDLTAGAYAQAGITNQLGGIEGTFATPIGTFRLDLAGSHTSAHSFDGGIYASYRFFDSNRPFAPSVTLSAQYRGRYLLGPESYLSQSPYKWTLQGSVSQALPKNTGLSLGLSYRLPWEGSAFYSGSAILSAPIGNGVSLSVTAGASYTPGNRITWSGGVSIISAGSSTTFSSQNQSLTDPNGQFIMTYRPPLVPGMSVTGSLSGPPGIPGQSTTASAALNYIGNRFRATVGQSVSGRGFSGQTALSNDSYLRFGSAVVYADGAFGITRPVTDDFAVIVPRGALRNTTIGVNQTANAYEAQSDFLGDAVLPDISSYTNELARIDLPQAPMGYDPGNTLYLLSLPYRSGAVIRVGTNATVYVEGTIVDEKGKPISLVAGSLTPENKASSAQLFFTDEKGQFQTYHLTPGAYTLTLSAGNWAPVTVTIPKGTTGLYKLGKITVKQQGGSSS